MDLFSLTGKTALVTGATHGLGMAMAVGLAEAGARVVVNGHSPDRMEKALEKYRRAGIETKGYLFDISDEQAVKEKISLIEKETGNIDILVNNAAITKRVHLKDMDLADFERIIRVDLTGAFIVSREVVKGMIVRGHGKIINICSMMTELARDTIGAYASAKGGLKMLTRSMATEWAPFNIQVNGIGPGYFETEQTSWLREPGNPLYEFIKKRTPSGRWGQPGELKGAVIFLASPASDYVNGHILYVDGGMMATLGKP